MTDQEEARGFLDSVSEAGSDESEPLIPPSVPPSSQKSPLARHVFAGLSFLGFANVYAMRVNLSVAIVAMVNQTAISHNRSSDNSSSCPVLGNTTQSLTDGPFDWGEREQGWLLGAFFWCTPWDVHTNPGTTFGHSSSGGGRGLLRHALRETFPHDGKFPEPEGTKITS